LVTGDWVANAQELQQVMKTVPENKSLLTPLLRWLIGDATRHDERALDAAAKSDPFLADAIEGYRTAPEADHAADVTRLKARLRKRAEQERGAGFYLMRIAAVGAVLVAAWVVMQQFVFSDKMGVADATQMEQMPTETAPATAADSAQFAIAEQEKPETTAASETAIAQQKALNKGTDAAPPQANAPVPTVAPASDEANKQADYAVADQAAAPQNEAAAAEKEVRQSRQAAAASAKEEAAKAPPKNADDKDKADYLSKKKSSASAKPAPAVPTGRTITGRVTDDNGNPLIGASVQATGSGIGIITDVDGNYSLTMPTGAETLVFSYTGYVQLQIGLGKSDKLNVQLANNDMELSEVVVITYGQSDDEEEDPVVSPRPVDGFKQFRQYVADNLRHPEANKQPRPRQVVRVRFTIEGDGSLSNLLPKGNAPQAYKDEAVRLLREGPRWKSTVGTTASYRFVFE
jgi:cytoskeletal protein RodZ